jgi:hypothetical protein
MRKSLFLVLAAALGSTCALAVDGVVLINQSTVMAAGGFPYTIMQPGSYKLSSNLTAPVNVGAIQVFSSNVSLDLNGFTISCSFTVSPTGGVFCISDSGITQFRKIAIRNGAIDVSQVGTGGFVSPVIVGVRLAASSNVIVEELQVEVHASFIGGALFTPPSALFLDGSNSIVRHNILRADLLGFTVIACPSLIVENVLFLQTGGPNTCVLVNNVVAN